MRMCTQGANDCGDRLRGVKMGSTNVGADGKINWAALGNYSFTLDKATKRVKTIRHKMTNCEVEMPDGLIVDNAFTLTSNFCQRKASFQKVPVR